MRKRRRREQRSRRVCCEARKEAVKECECCWKKRKREREREGWEPGEYLREGALLWALLPKCPRREWFCSNDVSDGELDDEIVGWAEAEDEK
jgi:hypothetical protein